MSRNKLIMVTSMLLTIVLVTDWLGNNKTASVSPERVEEGVTGQAPPKLDHTSVKPAPVAGTSAPSFPGNTVVKPEGALAHYELALDMGASTVFEDRIETQDEIKKSVIPFTSVINIQEDINSPGTVLIEYTNEQGAQSAYITNLAGQHEIDRLISLLKKQHSAATSR